MIHTYTPSKTLCATLGILESSPHIWQVIKNHKNKSMIESTLVGVTIGAMKLIEEFYRHSDILADRSPREFDHHEVLQICYDGITNAQEHGSKHTDYLALGLFLGEKGVSFGFYDQGGFFKRRKIKRLFENRIPLPLEEIDLEAGMCRIGVREFIYKSDFIEVDTTNGVLYCGQLCDKFLL